MAPIPSRERMLGNPKSQWMEQGELKAKECLVEVLKIK